MLLLGKGHEASIITATGSLPYDEKAEAVKAAVDEARICKETGQAKCIVFNLSGHGHFDLAAYENYLSGKLQDYEYPGRDVERALAAL